MEIFRIKFQKFVRVKMEEKEKAGQGKGMEEKKESKIGIIG